MRVRRCTHFSTCMYRCSGNGNGNSDRIDLLRVTKYQWTWLHLARKTVRVRTVRGGDSESHSLGSFAPTIFTMDAVRRQLVDKIALRQTVN